ncbi:MAG: ABC transporter ATP-binding protein [Clostridiales bacterium]|nr:ABC transporter ATP-binding protein [Clostridiales bacterium]
MDVLTVKGLKKNFGKNEILKGIDFSVQENEIVGFLGPNGSGKSTTIKCICGLYHMSEGEIAICGHDIGKARTEALKMLGASIESPALYPQLTGEDHLKMIARWRKVNPERLKEMEEYAGIGHYMKKKTGTYSMGMKMLLMLSMTLMAKPKLIILDEPTNGLDPQAVFELRKEMEEIRNMGSSILFSSHQLSEVERLSDRVVILNKGELIYDGSLPRDLTGGEYRLLVEPGTERKGLEALERMGISACGMVENQEHWIFFRNHTDSSLGELLACVGKEIPVYDVVKYEMDLEEFYKKIYERKPGGGETDDKK